MYCIDYNAEEPIMMLDRHIGFDEEDGQGIDGAAFAQELLQLDTMGKKSIQIYINCPGGSVMDGMNIYNAIIKSKTPVDTHNVGIAASMGGVCFMAGRKRVMADYASLMLHNPSGTDDKKALDSLRESIVTMLSAKSSISAGSVSYLMEKTTWLNAAECFEKGFCTDIAVTSEQNKKRMPTVAKDMWKFSNEIVNNLFKIDNNMKKVTAKLNLSEGSTEDAIVSAIDSLNSELASAKNEATEATGKLTAAEQKVADLEAELQTAKDELQAAKDEAAQAVTDKAESEAEAVVNEAIKVGKIKNESKESWKALAVKDLAGTKKMIDDLPLNKVANKAEETKVDETLKGTAAFKMFEIANKTK